MSAKIKPMKPYCGLILCWFFLLYGCGGGREGSSETIEETEDDFYEPISEAYANEKYEELGFTTDMTTVLVDGTENSLRGIADINRVLIDRGDNGDLYISYDALIYSLGFEFLDPDSWTGSNKFFLFIDNDNDVRTGEEIGGIGADIRLTSLGQHVWNDSENIWSSTWFESEPPFMDLRHTKFGLYEITSKLNGDEPYIRVIQGVTYLDALALNTDAKTILTIPYEIVDESTQTIVSATLDSTSAFELPDM